MARSSFRLSTLSVVATLLLAGFAPRAASADILSRVADAAADPLPASADEIVGEIVVELDESASPSEVASLEQRYGLAPNSAYSREHDHIELGAAPPDREDALLDALSHEPGVVSAERMEVLRASFVPDDPLYKEQWHLTRVGAETAWEYSCGRGVTVAVIDTGVACFDKGPFSRGSDLVGTRCEGGKNFVDDSKDAYDDQGHGTHVAGTIAQATDNGKGTAGLAFCSTLMPVKVLNRFGWGTLADVAEGVRFAADHGAQIINMSLGGSSSSRILKLAVDHARDRGVLVVAAAGNSGRAVGYPAAYDGVLAVSATDSNDAIAWFSSRGPQVGIAAPGVGVTQQTICQGGRNKCELFGTFNGTSMASPHVAGSAALVMGLGITSPTAAVAALTDTARQGATSDPKLYGAGIVDAGAAVRGAFLGHLAWRGGLIVALLLWIWRRIRGRGRFAFGPGAAFGALLGGVGLLPFLPLAHLLPRFGAFRWVGELLSRPFGEWDVLLGGGLHRWLPLANALPVLGATAIFFGVKRLRPTLGGFAVGTAALLTQLALQLDVVTPAGSLATRGWLVANAALCLWLARSSLDAGKA